MLHLLLVEDNPADVLMVREAVRTSPVMSDVLIAYDGKQARLFLNDFHFEPDLVFLDLKVPLLNSFEFLEALRKRRGTARDRFNGFAQSGRHPTRHRRGR